MSKFAHTIIGIIAAAGLSAAMGGVSLAASPPVSSGTPGMLTGAPPLLPLTFRGADPTFGLPHRELAAPGNSDDQYDTISIGYTNPLSGEFVEQIFPYADLNVSLVSPALGGIKEIVSLNARGLAKFYAKYPSYPGVTMLVMTTQGPGVFVPGQSLATLTKNWYVIYQYDFSTQPAANFY